MFADPQRIDHRLERENPRGADSLDVRDRGPGSGRQQEPIEGKAGPVVQHQCIGVDLHGPAAQQHPRAHPLGVVARS